MEPYQLIFDTLGSKSREEPISTSMGIPGPILSCYGYTVLSKLQIRSCALVTICMHCAGPDPGEETISQQRIRILGMSHGLFPGGNTPETTEI